MPQMKPMNWLFLFFGFTLILLSMNIFNYFSFFNKNKNVNKNLNKNLKTSNWKW